MIACGDQQSSFSFGDLPAGLTIDQDEGRVDKREARNLIARKISMSSTVFREEHQVMKSINRRAEWWREPVVLTGRELRGRFTKSCVGIALRVVLEDQPFRSQPRQRY